MADLDRRPRLNMPSSPLSHMAPVDKTAPWEGRPALPPSLVALCRRVVGAALQKVVVVFLRCPSPLAPARDTKYLPGPE